MRRYSEAVKADVRRLMSPPMRQSVAQISAEPPGIQEALRPRDRRDCNDSDQRREMRWF